MIWDGLIAVFLAIANFMINLVDFSGIPLPFINPFVDIAGFGAWVLGDVLTVSVLSVICLVLGIKFGMTLLGLILSFIPTVSGNKVGG